MASPEARRPASVEPPRILQCCAVDFTVAKFLLPLMRAQRGWGFDVHFACAPGPLVGGIEAEGFAYRPVPFRRGFNPVPHLAAFRKLLDIAREGDYAAVHLHTPVASLLGRPAVRRAGAPLVLYTAHGFYFHEAMPAGARRLHIELERRAHRSADFLFTQSREDAVTAEREGIALPGRILAIGNGVDLSLFSPATEPAPEQAAVREEFGFPAAGPMALMMGRVVREKGYGELIDAWAAVAQSLPHARLLCVGPTLESERGNYLPEARRRVVRSGLEGSVVFAGMREDIPRLLRAADLFVLPSWREGLPRSIIEAMACGRAVVATDIRGSREAVVDGETGRLVPARAAAPLAEAMLEVMTNAPLRAAMGEAGRRRAEAHFDERDVIEAQRVVYRRLFEEKGMPWPGGA
jgi:glycosyltransferase involved in cell wall biosynthesis